MCKEQNKSCGNKGKCCKAFVTIAGKDQPTAEQPQTEQPKPEGDQAKKCCGGCCKKKADQPKP